jgi:predicted transcriptional regulator
MPRRKRGQRGTSGVSRARWEQAWRLVDKKGWTQREAARWMHVSHTLVGYYLAKGPPPGWHPDKRPKAPVIDLRQKRDTRQGDGGRAP